MASESTRVNSKGATAPHRGPIGVKRPRQVLQSREGGRESSSGWWKQLSKLNTHLFVMCKHAWTHSPCSIPKCPAFQDSQTRTHSTTPNVTSSCLLSSCCPPLIGQSPPLKTPTHHAFQTQHCSSTSPYPSPSPSWKRRASLRQDSSPLFEGRAGLSQEGRSSFNRPP